MWSTHFKPHKGLTFSTATNHVTALSPVHWPICPVLLFKAIIVRSWLDNCIAHLPMKTHNYNTTIICGNIILLQGARGGEVVEELRYDPEGRGFENR
jgi:hypothetical protein